MDWKNQITEIDEEEDIQKHLTTVANDAMLELRKELVLA